MSVVPYTRPPELANGAQLEGRHRWVALLPEVAQLAHAIANTNFVPKALRGDEAAITAAILYGDEIGLAPMQALKEIAIIDGKPSLSAQGQRTLILGAGHDIWFEQESVTKVTVAGRRRESDQVSRVTWTLDDAKRAGIAGKQNWRQYPRAMLKARASAELARDRFADAIGGLAATEELEEQFVDGQAPTVADEAPQPPATRRRRKTAPAAATVPAPPSAPADPPLPPLPGEDEDPPEPPPEPASEAQLKKLHAMFREAGIDDRDERLAYSARAVNRTVLSSTELTMPEASALIDMLEQDTPEPDAGDAAPAPVVTADKVEILRWMIREADVDSAWIRVQLVEAGLLDPPQKITVSVLKTLTPKQAGRLQSALSDVIDARTEEDPEQR